MLPAWILVMWLGFVLICVGAVGGSGIVASAGLLSMAVGLGLGAVLTANRS